MENLAPLFNRLVAPVNFGGLGILVLVSLRLARRHPSVWQELGEWSWWSFKAMLRFYLYLFSSSPREAGDDVLMAEIIALRTLVVLAVLLNFGLLLAT